MKEVERRIKIYGEGIDSHKEITIVDALKSLASGEVLRCEITQGYLQYDALGQVRVRRIVYIGGGREDEYTIGIKENVKDSDFPNSLVRNEVELPIDKELFNDLFQNCDITLSKYRVRLPWESINREVVKEPFIRDICIDLFEDGCAILEVEFDDDYSDKSLANVHFKDRRWVDSIFKPSGFNEYLIYDVTDQSYYSNYNIAKRIINNRNNGEEDYSKDIDEIKLEGLTSTELSLITSMLGEFGYELVSRIRPERSGNFLEWADSIFISIYRKEFSPYTLSTAGRIGEVIAHRLTIPEFLSHLDFIRDGYSISITSPVVEVKDNYVSINEPTTLTVNEMKKYIEKLEK